MILQYELDDVIYRFPTRDNAEHVEEDHDKMLAILLVRGVVFSRDGFTIINKDSKYEASGEGTALYVNTNDMFAWGCADAEDLPHEEIPKLFMHYHQNGADGVVMWACYRNQMQPQRAVKADMIARGVWNAGLEALTPNMDSRPKDAD